MIQTCDLKKLAMNHRLAKLRAMVANRPLMIVATHGLALGIGWALWAGSGGLPRHHGPSGAASERSNQRTRSSNRVDATAAVSDAEVRELLASVRSSENAADVSKDWKKEREEVEKMKFSRIDTFKIPADFGKALEETVAEIKRNGGLVDKDTAAEIIALTYHWLARDPEGLTAGMAAGSNLRGSLVWGLRALMPEIYRRQGLEGALSAISQLGESGGSASRGLGEAVGKKMDGSAIAGLKQTLQGDAWNSFVTGAGSAWPVSNVDGLVKLAVELDAPRLVLGMMNSNPDQMARLAGLMNDSTLPENFRDVLRNSNEMRYALMNHPTLPLDLRLQGVDAATLVRCDTDRVFNQKRDWPFAVRCGEATAEEALAAVAAETPELAAKEPSLLRDWVFRELAEDNPTAAMELLKDEPEDVRNRTALLTSRTHFENIEPDKFLEMVQQIPSDTPETWEGRLDAWNLRSFTNHNRLNEAYVEWVENLPAGLDREMALYSLARAVNDPTLAARLRAQVKDPELQQRIAKHQ